jgi:hypothetical protein
VDDDREGLMSHRISSTFELAVASGFCLAVASLGCRPSVSSADAARPTAPSTAPAEPAEPAEPADASARRLPAGTIATIDNETLHERDVEELRAEAKSRLSRNAPEPTRDALVDALIHTKLLELEAKRLGLTHGVLEEAEEEFHDVRHPGYSLIDNGWTMRDAEWLEIAVIDALGLLEVSPAEISARHEQTKDSFTSDAPWIRGDIIRFSWHASIGVATCNAYVVGYRRCIDERVPTAARVPMRNALDTAVDGWRAAAATDRSRLDASCKAAFDAARAATRSMGCDWGPVAKREIAAEKKRVRHLAETVRTRAMAPDVGLRDAAVELGWRERFEDESPVVRTSSLARRVGKLAETLPLAALSPVVDDAGSFWLLQIVDRGAPGPLPLEARRPEIVRELRRAKLDGARIELRERLRASHEIVRADHEPAPHTDRDE